MKLGGLLLSIGIAHIAKERKRLDSLCVFSQFQKSKLANILQWWPITSSHRSYYLYQIQIFPTPIGEKPLSWLLNFWVDF